LKVAKASFSPPYQPENWLCSYDRRAQTGVVFHDREGDANYPHRNTAHVHHALPGISLACRRHGWCRVPALVGIPSALLVGRSQLQFDCSALQGSAPFGTYTTRKSGTRQQRNSEQLQLTGHSLLGDVGASPARPPCSHRRPSLSWLLFLVSCFSKLQSEVRCLECERRKPMS